MVVKFIIVFVWLGAAYWLHGYPTGRKIFAYVGAIVALVHLGAIAGAALLDWFAGNVSVEGGVNMAGFFVGCLLGLVLGCVVGSFAAKNDPLYWIAQVASAAFLAFFPLYR